MLKVTPTQKTIILNNNAVMENSPGNTVIGELSLKDSKDGDYEFSLVKGVGDEDNRLFKVEGNKLLTNLPLDYDKKTIRTIRIKADGEQQIEDFFSIYVTDQHQANSLNDCEDSFEKLSSDFNDIALNSNGDIILIGDDGKIQYSNDQGNSWAVINSGVSSDLYSIIFQDSTAYIAGDDVLLKSEDDGISWFQLYVPFSSRFSTYRTFFLTQDEGFIAGNDGMLAYTSSGGENWEITSDGTFYDFLDLWFWDSQSGIAIQDSHEIVKTSNGGKTWTQIDTDNLGYFNRFKDIWFFDQNQGFLLSDDYLFKTVDGGETWDKVNSISGQYLTKILFVNDQTGYISGGWSGYELFKTKDGGSTWNHITLPGVRAVKSLAADPDNNNLFLTGNSSGLGYTGEPGHFILSSNTEGASWKILSELNSENYRSVAFPDKDTGYLFGEHNTFKTSNSGISWELTSIGGSIYDAYFFDENEGFLTDGDSIYKTIDGGKTMSGLFGKDPFQGYGMTKIHVINRDLIFYYGSDKVYRTENGGTDWKLVAEGSSIQDLYFPSENTGYYVDLFGDIYKSSDGGNTWTFTSQLRDDDSYSVFHAIYFLNDQNGYVAGEDGILYKTNDGGINWKFVFTGIKLDIKQLHFNSDMEAYALAGIGGNGYIYYSSDQGETWKSVLTVSDDIYEMALQDNSIFIAGEYGFLGKLKQNSSPTRPGYIIGDTLVCNGSTVTYQVAENDQREYFWSVSGAELHYNRSAATIHFTEIGEYNIELYHYNNCGTSESRGLTVNVQELIQPDIIGPDSVNIGRSEVTYLIEDPEKQLDIAWDVYNAKAFSKIDTTSIEVDWKNIESTGDVSVIITDTLSGCRAGNNLDIVITSTITGLDDFNQSDIVLYPNPTMGRLFINSQINKEIYIEVYDLTGKYFNREKIDISKTETINFQDLPSGSYGLKIYDKSGNQIDFKRIIKH